MGDKSKQTVSGVMWIVFGPLALLMALIAKTATLSEYYVGVGLCGTWSICGVVRACLADASTEDVGGWNTPQ